MKKMIIVGADFFDKKMIMVELGISISMMEFLVGKFYNP